MSTQKWSDDDLDDLFRKSAEESDPAYDPAAWQDLKGRLNDRDRTVLLKWLLPALILLLAVGSLIWYTRQSATDQPIAGVHKSTDTSPSPGVETSTKSHEYAPITSVSKTTKQSPIAHMPLVVASQRSVTPVPETQSIEPGSRLTEKANRNGSIKGTPNGKPTGDNITPHKVAHHESITTPSAGKPTPGKVIKTPVLLSGHPDAPITIQASPLEATEVTSQPVSSTNPFNESESANGVDNTSPKRVLKEAPGVKRTLVADRPSVYQNGKARQDAKTDGLGRHRSVVSGLVHRYAPIGKSSLGNETTGSDSYRVSVSNEAVNQSVADPTTTRLIWPELAFLTARGTKWLTTENPGFAVEPIAWVDTAAPAPRPVRFRRPGLSIQLVLSPDLSTIGLHDFDRPGSNIGLMAQYQITDRFSFQTGALWSTKIYKTNSSEYVWPVQGGTMVWPESISGKCTMLDIPLNLRYDVVLNPGGSAHGPTRWFVSGGITSYFINREIYTYNYANPDDPAIKYRSWDSRASGRPGSSFGLSNINISVGYERPVSKRLSWQIEPFMKIPIQQIGYFKVRLLSSGAFLSLRYRF